MSYRVQYTRPAENDLESIYFYIAIEKAEPYGSKNFIVKLMKECRTLEELPYRCPKAEISGLDMRGVRKMTVGNYLVLFRTLEKKGIVEILRIVYAGRDLSAALRNTDPPKKI